MTTTTAPTRLPPARLRILREFVNDYRDGRSSNMSDIARRLRGQPSPQYVQAEATRLFTSGWLHHNAHGAYWPTERALLL